MQNRNILFFILSILLLTGCENYPYSDDLTTKGIFNFRVNASDWEEYVDADGLNRYYSCSFRLSGITDSQVLYGAAMAYVDYGSYQQTLPYTRHFENINGQMWTRTIDFDYSSNNVTFYVTNSDFASDPPDTMDFRLVFIW